MKRAANLAAVFIDRDGTLIREVNYLTAIEQIEILPGVAAALRRLRTHGFKLVMVTNQSVIARGALSEAGLEKIHAEIAARLAHDDARLDAIYYCPHHPTEGLGEYRVVCDCRKPKTGMIRRAAAELHVDPTLSYVVGDQLTDMELARAVGATGILVGRDEAAAGAGLTEKFLSIVDLNAAASWIVEQSRLSQQGCES